MADFDKAYEKLKVSEGGYVNNPNDKGGETIWGIARKYQGNNKYLRDFWRELDTYKQSLKDLTGQNFVKQLNTLCNGNSIMQNCAKSFYKNEYWNKIKGDYIKEQKLAENIFDFFVTSGDDAVKILQSILGITKDGIFGSETLDALNNSEIAINNAYTNARINYYKSLNQEQFVKGWIARAEKFR